jgi:hypothetical protein
VEEGEQKWEECTREKGTRRKENETKRKNYIRKYEINEGNMKRKNKMKLRILGRNNHVLSFDTTKTS